MKLKNTYVLNYELTKHTFIHVHMYIQEHIHPHSSSGGEVGLTPLV